MELNATLYLCTRMNKYTVFFHTPAFQNTEPNTDLIRPKYEQCLALL